MQRRTCPICNVTYPARLERCPDDGALLETRNPKRAPWAAGKLIGGRYVIFAETGSNEVTICYRVRMLDLDEPRSLRALQPGFAEQKAAAQEFRRAARLLGNIHHPNLVAVEFAGDAEDGTPFVVTEILPGKSLTDVIRAEAPLPAVRVCSIARQIAAGLDAAHRRGLLHLGLNPSVVFVSGPTENEAVKLEDFGADYVRMGRTVNGGRRSGLALRDFMPENSIYCSPEQAMGRHFELLDARADLYSLGLLTFQMLTGRLPFGGRVRGGDDQARLESLVAHLEEPVVLSPAESAEIPEPLVTLMRQLLEKRPQLRPANARQVIEKLAMVEDWTAARALMGPRSEPVVVSAERIPEAVHESPALLAKSQADNRKEAASNPASIPDQVTPSLDAVPLHVVRASLSEAAVERVLDRAGAVVAETPVPPSQAAQSPSGRSDSGSVLFKQEPARRRTEWGRRAVAALALVIVAAGTLYLIIHGVAPGPGPLSPVKSDELRTAAGANSTAAPAKLPTQPPETSPQTQTSDRAASAAATVTGPPARTGAAAATRSASTQAPASANIAAEVERAITAGDFFFEQGKYDLAIQTYEHPLKLDPGNAALRAKIGRARKAKAAEDEYLGQQ